MHNANRLLAVLFAIALSGCATIMGEETQLLSVTSTPSNADVVITNEKGKRVFQAKTPANVSLAKSDGSYWGGLDYTVTISKDGYKTQSIPVKARPNGWYVAGNFVFGGLIGWLVVDPLSGAMYNLEPEYIQEGETDGKDHNNSGKEGSIAIVLLEDVPEHLREKMKPIN